MVGYFKESEEEIKLF